MTKVILNNGNEQIQTSFHGIYLNLTAYLFLSKHSISMTFKIKFLNFMTKVNPKMKMKQNQTFSHGIYSNVTPFFYQHVFKVFQ